MPTYLPAAGDAAVEKEGEADGGEGEGEGVGEEDAGQGVDDGVSAGEAQLGGGVVPGQGGAVRHEGVVLARHVVVGESLALSSFCRNSAEGDKVVFSRQVKILPGLHRNRTQKKEGKPFSCTAADR